MNSFRNNPNVNGELVTNILTKAGITGPFSITPLSGGGNNRVYELKVHEQAFLLKSYFHHPDDPRDRLKHEFAFLSFLWKHEIHHVPQPLVQDADNHLGLYEFVPGRRLQSEEVTKDRVDEALRFFLQLNSDRFENEAALLPTASEACFSLSEHLAQTEKRIARLQSIATADDISKEARDFVTSKLLPLWEKVSAKIRAQLGSSADRPLAQECRCLSPSDFGYHNALLRPNGELCWLDFEYSGWDDPAKTVCDFFAQPVLTVPESFFTSFVDQVSAAFPADEYLRTRISQLRHVYRIKWCCIMLNEFLPMDQTRRQFAKQKTEAEALKKQVEQLGKAKALLAKCETAFDSVDF